MPTKPREFELIDLFTKAFEVSPAPRGPGDDCAVLGSQCVTTDALVEGVHFTRRHFSLEDVGHKALAVNLSDVAAMGARPTWALCALGLPKGTTSNEVRALGKGMAALAKAHGVELVGGNVTRAPELTLTMTVAGEAKRPLLRSGARPGDAVYVSGTLGAASAGLRALRRGAQTGRLVLAQRRPQPHVAFGLAIAPFASACIDVSDGLAQDLGHLCTASGVGAELSSALLPLSEELVEAEGLRRAQLLALTGGEDYVLAFTVPSKREAAFQKAMRQAGFSAMVVGAITRRAQVTVDGRAVERAGFSHL